MKDFIAIDIGASSGRLIHGYLTEDNKLETKEIHRFKNGFYFIDNHDRWAIDSLIKEIFLGLEKAKKQGIDSAILGIDTWGVDYVLVGDDGNKLADPISYRDNRTQNKITELSAKVSKEEIYKKTGIQFLEFNTLYQLYVEDRELLKKAKKLLLIPDYIGYILTGKAVTEVTNASTTQMLNLREELFDIDLLEAIDCDAGLFSPLVDSGTILGKVQEKYYEQFDLPEIEVVTVATHDTASAVVGVPVVSQEESWAFLSSGTWSLIGVEHPVPINTPEAFENNFTNEWGAYGTYRFLKNIMGMWIVQEVQRLWEDGSLSFPEIAKAATATPFYQSLIDVTDVRFTNPENMILEIQEACEESGQKIPKTIGELANCVYSSLAVSYQKELKTLENITATKIDALYIVGGGSNVDILNQITANLTGVKIYAGPSEATAIGNLAVQMIAEGEIQNVASARKIIHDSFGVKHFIPEEK